MTPISDSIRAGSRSIVPTEVASTTALPLTIYDRQVDTLEIRQIFVYPRGLDVGRLVETLPRALTPFAPLAGRLRDGPTGRVIDTTPRGVQLTIVDHAASTPRELAPGDVQRTVDQHVAARGRDRPLVTVQINRMADGGAIVGFAYHHAVMDGPSCFQFLRHWAALARGEAEVVTPCHRRAELEALCQRTAPVDPASLGLRPAKLRELAGLVATGLTARALLVRVRLEFDAPGLAALKARALADLPADTIVSSNDVLAAEVWQRFDRIDGVTGDRPCATITNPRGSIGELAGPGYFGNFNDLARAHRPASDTLGARAVALRAAAAAASGPATLARGRVLQDLERGGPRLLPAGVLDTLHGAPLINNWSRFPIFALDFGTGPPRWFDVPLTPLRRLAIVTAHPDDPGGRLVHLTVTRGDRRALAAYRP